MKLNTEYKVITLGATLSVVALLLAGAYAISRSGEVDWTWWYELTLPQALVLVALIIGLFGSRRRAP